MKACFVVGATGKDQKQKTVSVYLKKTTGMDSGLIFHEKLYHSSGVRSFYICIASNLGFLFWFLSQGVWVFPQSCQTIWNGKLGSETI